MQYGHLGYFGALRKLDIGRLDGDISWLTQLHQLTELRISHLDASDLTPLYHLPKLTHLTIIYFHRTPIDIQRLQHLQEINISKNPRMGFSMVENVHTSRGSMIMPFRSP